VIPMIYSHEPEPKTLAQLCRREHYEKISGQEVYCTNNEPYKCPYANKCYENGAYRCMKLDKRDLWKYQPR
jgi:hypothetical protein